MKVVPFENETKNDTKNGDEIAIPDVPDVSEGLYGELFFAADWAVRNRPWEGKGAGVGSLFEIGAESAGGSLRGALQGGAGGPVVLSLVRENAGPVAGAGERLEVQFLSSDFLQGHDYELNVRYAPEGWDACECDVIVLRAIAGDQGPAHPTAEQVELLTEGLRALQAVAGDC